MSQLFVCLFLFNTISQTQSPQDVLYCNVKALHSCMYLYFCLWAHFASSCISSLTDSASISVSPDLPRPLKLPARYCFCSVQVLHWALQPTSVCCRCLLSLEGSVEKSAYYNVDCFCSCLCQSCSFSVALAAMKSEVIIVKEVLCSELKLSIRSNHCLCFHSDVYYSGFIIITAFPVQAEFEPISILSTHSFITAAEVWISNFSPVPVFLICSIFIKAQFQLLFSQSHHAWWLYLLHCLPLILHCHHSFLKHFTRFSYLLLWIHPIAYTASLDM